MSWQPLSAWFVEISYAGVQLGVGLLLQSTVLIGLGLVAARLARSKGAAVRSAVYRTTLAAVVLCPVVSVVLDQVGAKGLLVALPEVDLATVDSAIVEPSNAEEATGRSTHDEGTAMAAEAWEDAARIDVAVREEYEVAESAVSHVETTPIATDDLSSPRDRSAWGVCLLTFSWLLGSCLLLARLAAAHLGMMRLVRTACGAEPATMAECRELAGRLGVRPPAVWRSPFISSPCLVGIYHPAILLPEVDPCDGSSQRNVLIHEMAHLARRDHVWNLLGRLGVAAVFFQPLLWLLVRRIVHAAEEVCDDYVVDFGLDRRDYARRLADIAEQYHPRASAAGVGIVSLRSLVGRRIVRILDGSRKLSLRAGAWAVLATVVLGAVGTALVGLLVVGARPVDAAMGADAPTTDLYGDPLPLGAVARIGTIRLRHTETVSYVAFSPDGKLLASSGRDGIRLWQTDGGRPVRWWPGEGRGIAFSPDGKTLAAARASKLHILDVSTGKELSVFEAKQIRGVAFAPDGSFLVGWGGTYSTRDREIVSSEGVVRLFDPTTGKVLRQLEGHQGYVSSASLSPDGKTLVTASHDNTIRYWETQTGRQLRQTTFMPDVRLAKGLWLPRGMTAQLAFSPSGQLLALYLPDYSIRLVNVDTGEELRRLAGHEDRVLSLAFSPDGKLLVSGGCDEMVRVWNVEAGRRVRQFAGHTSWIHCVAFSPDSRTVASGSQDQTVRLWDVADGKELHPTMAPPHQIRAASLASHGKWLATAGTDGLHLWDTETGRLLAMTATPDFVNCLDCSPDGEYLVSGTWGQGIHRWEVSNGDEGLTLAHAGHVPGHDDAAVLAVAFAPDGARLVTGGRDRTVRYLDVASGKEVRRWRVKDTVSRVACSPDGRYIAAICRDSKVRVWDVDTDGSPHEFDVHTEGGGHVGCIAFTPDSRTLVVGGAGDGCRFRDRKLVPPPSGSSSPSRSPSIRFYDVATGKETGQIRRDPMTLLGSEPRELVCLLLRVVYSVAVSPDGRLLASAEARGGTTVAPQRSRILLHEMATGRLLAEWEAHEGSAVELAFSRDGRRLVSTGKDDLTALVWDVKTVLKEAAVEKSTTVRGGAGVVDPQSVPPREPSVTEAVTDEGTDAAAEEEPAEQPPIEISALGKVVDMDGKPIVSATVYLRTWTSYWVYADPYNQTPQDVFAITKTNAQGMFRFEKVKTPSFDSQFERSAKNAPWVVVATADGYGVAWQHLETHCGDPPMTLTMQPEAKLTGRLVDGDDRPVSGVRVEWTGITPLDSPVEGPADEPGRLWLWPTRPEMQAQTDADGRFTFAGLPPNMRVFLIHKHPKYAQAHFFAATTNDPQPKLKDAATGEAVHEVHTGDFTVRLEPGYQIHGRVVYADTKQPCPDARVQVSGKSRSQNAIADAAGRFAFGGLEHPQWRVSAFTPERNVYLGRRMQVTVSSDASPAEVTIELPRGEKVTGSVVDEETGEAVAGVEVRYSSEVPNNAPDRVYARYGTTDASGAFQAWVPEGSGVLVISSRIDGYDIPFRSRGDEPRFARFVSVKSGRPVDPVRFSVTRGLIVNGQVTDPQGQPLADAEVEVVDIHKTRERRVVQTDAEGRFTFTGLSPKVPQLLHIRHAQRKLTNMVPISASENRGATRTVPLSVTLDRAAIVKGRLTSSTRPMAGVAVDLQHSSTVDGAKYTVTVDRRTTDDSGCFEFDLTPPGSFSIRASPRDGPGRTLRNSLDLAPGETRELELKLR